MCGIIIGLLRQNSREAQIAKALDQLKHRGPDAQAGEYFLDRRFFLGHTRLKVIDLTDQANQPLSSGDNRYRIVFNGEIYNYKELAAELHNEYQTKTKSDTEIILPLYNKYGAEMLSKLRGMFSLCILDTIRGELFVARDRFGIKPLYYVETSSGIYLASEIPPLLDILQKSQPDLGVIRNFVETGLYDFGERTFFERVKRFPAGHYAYLDHEKTSVEPKKWYDLLENIQDNSRREPRELIELFKHQCAEAVRFHMVADVEVGINLSGGVDSSLLAFFASKESGDLQSFTQDWPAYSEAYWVKIMTESLGIRSNFVHVNAGMVQSAIEKVVKFQSEPFGGFPVIGYHYLYQEAVKNNITVLLDGNGLDESFLGYDKYRRVHQNCMPNVKGQINNVCDGVSAIDGTMHMNNSEILGPELKDVTSYKPITQKPFESDAKNAAYNDLVQTKIPRGLRFNDRASMMHSRELRVPFLDHNLVELGFSFPIDLLIGETGTKEIVRKAAMGCISKNLSMAPKRSVQSPQREWLAGEMKDFVLSVIESKSFSSRMWFNKDTVKREYKNYQNSDRKNSFHVWQWVNLELWAREFLD